MAGGYCEGKIKMASEKQRFQPHVMENRELLLAPKARACRGVRGHAPPGNFANLGSLKFHFLNFDIIPA